MKVTKLTKQSFIEVVASDQPALVLTTPNMLGRNSEICELLSIHEPCKQIDIFDKVREYPSLDLAYTFYRSLKSLNYKTIYAIGGGSVIDVAKVVKASLLLGSFADSHKLKVSSSLKYNACNLVSIPTTAGSGAEVTPFAALWDLNNNKKLSLDHELLSPNYVYYHSSYLNTLSCKQTVITCLDSLSHVFDVLWNRNADSLAISNSITALKILIKILPQLSTSINYSNLYEDLFAASYYSGLAIASTRTSLAHGLSYQLTSKFNIPHGIATSLFLPTLICFYSSYISSCLIASNTFQSMDGLIKYSYNLSAILYNIHRRFDFIEALSQIDPDYISIDEIVSNVRTKNAIKLPTHSNIKSILARALEFNYSD